MKTVVIGAGSWGSALTLLLGWNGHEVTLVARDAETAHQLETDIENKQYLPGTTFSSLTQFVGQGTELPEADFVVVAVPAKAVDETMPLLEKYETVCVASKGLHLESGMTLGERIELAYPDKQVTALSGPNLAVEIAARVPTAAVCAGPDEATTKMLREAFSGPTFRVYVSEDRKGVELGGALKNVVAIGAGISDGLGFGDNTKGAFVSRGLSEMTRLGTSMGARLETFLGLAGVGDLFATASSKLSRNYRVGRAIGEGRSLEAALEEVGQVAEGVDTCQAALQIAWKKGLELPLMETLHEVMHGKTTPQEAISRLMERNNAREMSWQLTGTDQVH